MKQLNWREGSLQFWIYNFFVWLNLVHKIFLKWDVSSDTYIEYGGMGEGEHTGMTPPFLAWVTGVFYINNSNRSL